MEDEYSQLPAEETAAPRPPRDEEEQGVEVPYELLQPDTLEQLIKAFVLREGTDYGEKEASLDRKIEDIRRQLASGELVIVFDLSTETGSIVAKRALTSSRS